MTIDSNTYGTTDPYTAGAYAVAESIRNIIAVYKYTANGCLF